MALKTVSLANLFEKTRIFHFRREEKGLMFKRIQILSKINLSAHTSKTGISNKNMLSITFISQRTTAVSLFTVKIKINVAKKASNSVVINPNGVGGLIESALFSDGYFTIKKGSGGPKFCYFS